jgi:hypothetical protein
LAIASFPESPPPPRALPATDDRAFRLSPAGSDLVNAVRPYAIEVTADGNAADVAVDDVAVDDAATPIRFAADGVQLVCWAPLAPVVVPILFLARARDR